MKVKLDKIKELRIEKKLTQEDLAFELDITQSQYGRLERGECEFDFDKLDKVAKLFQLNPNEIIDFDEKYVLINSYNGTYEGNNSNNFISNNFVSSIESVNQISKDDIREIIQEELKELFKLLISEQKKSSTE